MDVLLESDMIVLQEDARNLKKFTEYDKDHKIIHEYIV